LLLAVKCLFYPEEAATKGKGTKRGLHGRR